MKMAAVSEPLSQKCSGERVLADLIEELTMKIQVGEPVDVEAFAAKHPEHLEDLRRLLPALEVLGDLSRSRPQEASRILPAAASGEESQPPSLGDYRIIREIGRGGMGVVYEAEQISLGRRVALKVLPFAAVLDQRQLQRFKNEAQAAAQLHHTNIVPVFSVGCERGVHYYAMQYIEGRTLADVIEELRALARIDGKGSLTPSKVTIGLSSGRFEPAAPARESATSGIASLPAAPRIPPGGTSIEPFGEVSSRESTKSRAFFRSVANLALQAAEALEHAHNLGVIHRDIKPSNLILDAKGNLWITDFGLAKLEGNPGLTMSGDLLGTLRYMSPEQALAKRILVDHRSDIYSLGVTIYELLTLEPAFSGQDREEVLRQIAFGEPKSCRKLNRSIPQEVETILMKAMAREPERRYATAGDLADDLRRFIEEKPILARPPTLLDHAMKWARRHRGLVASGAAFLLLAVLGLAGGLVLLAEEQARTEAALGQSRKNFRKAVEAVEKMLVRVGDQRLAQVPGMEPVQRALLEDALAFFQGFLEEKGKDPEVRFESGRARRRVGEIHRQLGQRGKAEEAFREAARRMEELTGEYPGVPMYRDELACALGWLGVICEETGRLGESRELKVRALGLYERLAAEVPSERRHWANIATCHNNLGTLLLRSSQLGEAIGEFGKARDSYAALVEGNPTDRRCRLELVRAYNNIAFLEKSELLRFEESERAYDAAIGILRRLVEELPGDPECRMSLAYNLAGRGFLLIEMERPGDAEAAFREALALLEKLVSECPGTVEYGEALASSSDGLGTALENSGHIAEGCDAKARAVLVEEGLAGDGPATTFSRAYLGIFYGNLGTCLGELGRIDDAQEAFARAAAIQEKLSTEQPDEPRFRQDLARTRFEIGCLHRDSTGDVEASLEAFEEALAIQEDLARRFPESAAYASELARTREAYGSAAGDPEEQGAAGGQAGGR